MFYLCRRKKRLPRLTKSAFNISGGITTSDTVKIDRHQRSNKTLIDPYKASNDDIFESYYLQERKHSKKINNLKPKTYFSDEYETENVKPGSNYKKVLKNEPFDVKSTLRDSNLKKECGLEISEDSYNKLYSSKNANSDVFYSSVEKESANSHRYTANITVGKNKSYESYKDSNKDYSFIINDYAERSLCTESTYSKNKDDYNNLLIEKLYEYISPKNKAKSYDDNLTPKDC